MDSVNDDDDSTGRVDRDVGMVDWRSDSTRDSDSTRLALSHS